ncbi:hypothetical protein [Pseudomonas sp. A34-9]|uniref:hypothetical protein n=1 Tax=Pseudomonas sp. A34-9 TaxID=3034675 RepID=UPI00240D01C8|nr:hypothetical protein [Pseudomonas sp. A34-9]
MLDFLKKRNSDASLVKNITETSSGTDFAKGTLGQRTSNEIDLKISSFSVTEKTVIVLATDPDRNKNPYGKTIFFTFPYDLPDGEHYFNEESRIGVIQYAENYDYDTPAFEGVRDNEGFVYIVFDKNHGTLLARLHNIKLAQKNGKANISIDNVSLFASGLIIND